MNINPDHPFESNPEYHGNNNGEKGILIHYKENDLNLFIASNNDSVVNEIEDNNGIKRHLGREDFPPENVNLFYNNGSITSSNENANSYNYSQKTNSKSTFSKPPCQITNQTSQSNINKTSFPPKTTQSAVSNSKLISKASISLNQKRIREEASQRNCNVNEVNNTENTKSNMNVQKFNLINSENLANLQSIFPLNLLSQNMGVINWVVPSDVLKNNVGNLEEKNDKV